jgi:hypothetical protein
MTPTFFYQPDEDVVTVKYVPAKSKAEPHPLLLMHNRRPYELKPNVERSIPVIVLFGPFGNPNSGHTRTKLPVPGMVETFIHVPSRSEELDRLCTWYGVYERGVPALQIVMPKIEVYDLESHERILFPADDPDLTSFVAPPSGNVTVFAMQEEMSRLRQQLRVMEEQLAGHTARLDDIEVDTPPSVNPARRLPPVPIPQG